MLIAGKGPSDVVPEPEPSEAWESRPVANRPLRWAYAAAGPDQSGWLGRAEFRLLLQATVELNALWPQLDAVKTLENHHRNRPPADHHTLAPNEFAAAAAAVGLPLLPRELTPEFEKVAGPRGRLAKGLVWRATFGGFAAWLGRRQVAAAAASAAGGGGEGWELPTESRTEVVEQILEACEADASYCREAAAAHALTPLLELLREPGGSQLQLLAAKTLAVISGESGGGEAGGLGSPAMDLVEGECERRCLSLRSRCHLAKG